MRIIIRAYFVLNPLVIIPPFVWWNHSHDTQKQYRDFAGAAAQD
jgi:hypothetical protein